MKTRNFKILLIGLILIIISLYFIINLYNKPFIDIEKSNPKIEITALEILNDYQADERLANEKYVDNLIQIKGEVADIKYENGTSVITLKGENDFSNIICRMLPEANLEVLKLKKGAQIMVKGVCTGYLLDVVMVRCILINDNFNEK